MSFTKVLVVGASGGTGRHAVAALAAKGVPARLLVRDAEAASSLFPGAELFRGDVLTSDLAPAFAGVDAVVSALGGRGGGEGGLRAVDVPGSSRLIAAARAAGIRRFVLCSTIGAVPTPGVPEHLLQAFAPKGEIEAELRASGVPFAIVRPGRLVDAPMPEEPKAIERRFVGAALVEALFRPDAENAVFELSQNRLARDGADPVLGLRVD